jgi:hypothetical protein
MEQSSILPRSANEGTADKRVAITNKQDFKEIGNNPVLNVYKLFAETIHIELISERSDVEWSEVK